MEQEILSKNKLTCTVTGVTVKVAPKVFDERVLVYGSPEELRKNYICANARKLLCAGKTVAELRAYYNVPETVPVPADSFIQKYTRWAKYRNKNTTPTSPNETVSAEQ